MVIKSQSCFKLGQSYEKKGKVNESKNFHACVELERLRFNLNDNLSDIVRNLQSLCNSMLLSACDLEKELTIKLNKKCDEAQISSCEALVHLYADSKILFY